MKTKPGSSCIKKNFGATLLILFFNCIAQAQTIDFQQAANQGHPTQPISWINGILNPNNSDYFEGVGIPQRILFTGIAATPGDTHALTFRHQALKGGVHTYDFLMGWDQAISTTAAFGQGSTNELLNLMAQQCNGAMSAAGLDACTSATFVLAINVPDDLGNPGFADCGFPPPIPVNPIIACFEGLFNDRFIHVYGNQPVLWGELLFTGYTDTSAQDVYATYTLRWKSTSDKVKITLAGRSSQSCISAGCCGYGTGCGAGSVSGGPYHFMLDDLDEAELGSQDNQVQANAAPAAPVCESVVITGSVAVCPNSTGNIYSAFIGGPCTNITHHWSITGQGSIVGSTIGASISVLANNCGQFTICDTITCDEGQLVCCTTINVVDSIAPVITCPFVSNVECPAAPSFGAATATDDCDTSPSIAFDDFTTPGSCPQEYSITRTWTATDDCGNSSTCSRTINVVDTTDPVITCPTVVSPIECPAAPSFGAATATDDCDTSPSIAFDDVTTPGSCPQEYSITRTWTATDDCGNSSTCSRTIVVEDTTPPIFVNCIPNIDLGFNPVAPDCINQAPPDVIDDCGIPTVTCSEGTIVNTSLTGRMRILTWIATDACGNSAICTTTFTWIEDTVLQCGTISGPGLVDTNSIGNVYTVNYSGTCSNVTHSWSLTGNGFIVGATNGISISVTATTVGQFTICDTITCDEGQIICCTTVDVMSTVPLQCLSMNGPDVIGTNSNATYSVNFSGTCSNVTHHWSISGNGTITSSAVDSFVSVTSGMFGPFTLCDTITCTEGQIICCATIDVLDSSSQWFPLNTGVVENLQRIQFPTNNTGFAGGFAPSLPPYLSSIIIRTTDEGDTWNSVFSSSVDFVTDFTFLSKRKGNAVTSGSGILKFNVGNNSTDWIYGAPVPTAAVGAFYFINNSVGFAGDSLGNVYKTTDGGNTWSSGTFIGTVSTLESFAFFTNNVGLVVGHDTSVIAKTTDGGNTWNIISLNYDLKSVYTIQGNAFATGADGTVIKSTDNGNTWSSLTSPVSWMNFNSVFCATNNVCYVVGDYGAIIKTIDGGITWQQQNSAIISNLNSVYCTSANNCYAAGDNGIILKTTTGGNRLYISNNNSVDEGFTFYPNPTSDILNFIFEDDATHTIQISNTLGKSVIREQTSQKTFSIKINSLSKGIYIIYVRSGETDIYVKRFLKM